MSSGTTAQHGITFNTGIDVLESMGSDVFVYFTRDIEQGVNAAELEELARDSGRADTGASGDTLVARLDAATGIREGQDAELWVDARALHVFDPSSGRNLSLGAGDGARARCRRRGFGSGRRHRRRQARRRPPSPNGHRSRARPASARGSRRPGHWGRRGYLISRRSRSITSSLHSWVRISRYRSLATRW